MQTTRLLLVITLLVSLTSACHHGPFKSPIPAATSRPTAEATYYFTAAQLKLKQRDIDGAIDLIGKALAADPQSGYLRVELAVLYLAKKDMTKAHQLVADALDAAPDNVRALILSGRIEQEKGNRKAAKKAYAKAIDVDPRRQNVYLALGRMYLADRQWAEAADVFRQMTTYFPENYVSHYFLGKALTALGDKDAAVAEFNRTLALEPTLEEPRVELLSIYKTRRHPGDAEQMTRLYQQILDNNPANGMAGIGLALHYRQLGQTEKAADWLAAMGRDRQHRAAMLETVIETFVDKKKFITAVFVLEGMLRGAPDDSDLHYLAGVALDGMNASEKALQHLLRVQPDTRFYENAVVHTAVLYRDTDQLEKAIVFLRKALSHDPNNTEYWLYLAGFYEDRKEYTSALETLEKGLSVDPKNWRLMFRRGVVYDKLGRKDDSIATMRAVLKVKPDHANAMNYLGYTFAVAGIHLDEAEQLVRAALKLKPDDGYITDSLAWIYYQRGDYKKALQYLNNAIAKVPDDPVILEHLGDVYRQLGHPDKARQYYRKSLGKKPSEENKKKLLDKIESLASP